MRELGYRTIEVEGGAHALQVLSHNPSVDVLFTDIAKPGMNGFQVAEEARRSRPDLPVLLMTGYADFADLNVSSISVPLPKKPLRLADLEPIMRKLPDEGSESET